MLAEGVVGVGQDAPVNGQAAAADAAGELVAELLERVDSLLELGLPAVRRRLRRKPLRTAVVGRRPVWQSGRRVFPTQWLTAVSRSIRDSFSGLRT